MKTEEKIKQLKNWMDLLSVFPEDSEAGRLRDEVWRGKLESEIVVLQHRNARNALTALCKVKNSLSLLKGSNAH